MAYCLTPNCLLTIFSHWLYKFICKVINLCLNLFPIYVCSWVWILLKYISTIFLSKILICVLVTKHDLIHNPLEKVHFSKNFNDYEKDIHFLNFFHRQLHFFEQKRTWKKNRISSTPRQKISLRSNKKCVINEGQMNLFFSNCYVPKFGIRSSE